MQGCPCAQQACCIAGILSNYVMSHRSTHPRTIAKLTCLALITPVPLRCHKLYVAHVDDNGLSMIRQWLRPLNTISHALSYFLRRFLTVLALSKPERRQSRMSWVFGVKPRASPSERGKSVDSSEKAVEKLQAYHELAKVLSARAPLHLHHHRSEQHS